MTADIAHSSTKSLRVSNQSTHIAATPFSLTPSAMHASTPTAPTAPVSRVEPDPDMSLDMIESAYDDVIEDWIVAATRARKPEVRVVETCRRGFRCANKHCKAVHTKEQKRFFRVNGTGDPAYKKDMCTEEKCPFAHKPYLCSNKHASELHSKTAVLVE